MEFRDRVKELRRVPASSILPHPDNWRVHSDDQRSVLAGVLSEIGIANAVIAYEREEDGALMLIDGHLRQEELIDALVPALILDVTDDEARMLLATLDPIAMMASQDAQAFDALLGAIAFESEAVNAMLEANRQAAIEAAEAEPPDEFRSFDENIETDFTCPKCDYSWSGQTSTGHQHEEGDDEAG